MDNAKRVIGLDGAASDSLLKVGRFFTKWDGTDDGRAVFREGGRKGDVFYRDRWSHDKVVRSTHGVNCTGSCPPQRSSLRCLASAARSSNPQLLPTEQNRTGRTVVPHVVGAITVE